MAEKKENITEEIKTAKTAKAKSADGAAAPAAEEPKKKKMTVVFRTQNSAQNSLKTRPAGTAPKRPAAARPAAGTAAKPAAAGTTAKPAASAAKPPAAAKAVKPAQTEETKAVKPAAEETKAAAPAKSAKSAAEPKAAVEPETKTAKPAAGKSAAPEAAPAAETGKKTAKTAVETKTAEPRTAKSTAPETKDAGSAQKSQSEAEKSTEPEKAAPAPRFVDMNMVRAAAKPVARQRISISGPGFSRGNNQGGFKGRPGAGAGAGNRGGRPAAGGFKGRDGQMAGRAPGKPGDGPSQGGFKGRPGAGAGAGGGGFQRNQNAYEMAMQRPGKNAKGRSQGNRFDKKNSDELRRPGVKVSNKDMLRMPSRKQEPEEVQIKMITIPEMLTIKDLADAMKIQTSTIIKKLFLQGKVVTVNDEIDYETAEGIALEFDVLCEKEVPVDVIAELLKDTTEESEENLVPRPPVVCVMGHVDHGKTSLLDAIRKTNVTSKEAGGITQAIGAYMVEINGRKITFLDTPGHEAFTDMRMRGAQATDIAILVVAADDGVMPQTVEAINHAKAAGVEIVVAINKIDKPGANIDKVKQELTEYGLVDESWGGSTTMVPISAKKGDGIEELLEMVLLEADVLELKADPNRNARGLVIEAKLDKGRGPVATVLVQKGTLHVGDTVAAGASYGKIRAMIDDKGKRVKTATPSTPVEILGLSDVPNAGEIFVATDSEKDARSFAETFIAEEKKRLLKETKGKVSLDDIFEQIKEGELKELNIIVKGDVQGSVEAVKTSLLKLSNDEVVVKIIHSAAGNINESDVTLASASGAIIIGFNVKVDATAKSTAETEKVDIRLYDVIYKAIEDVEAAMKGMLAPTFEERILGHAVVRQTFKASAIGTIAGCFVLDGKIVRGCKCRITRDGEQIFDGPLSSLKRFKDDVKEVRDGYECGLVFDGWSDLAEDDQIEAYDMVEVERS